MTILDYYLESWIAEHAFFFLDISSNSPQLAYHIGSVVNSAYLKCFMSPIGPLCSQRSNFIEVECC